MHGLRLLFVTTTFVAALGPAGAHAAPARGAAPAVLVAPPALGAAFTGRAGDLHETLTQALRDDARVQPAEPAEADPRLRNCLGQGQAADEGACWAAMARRLDAPGLLTARVAGSSVRCDLELALSTAGQPPTIFRSAVWPCGTAALRERLPGAVSALLDKAGELIAAPAAETAGDARGLQWIPIPGGGFSMGAADGDDDERPVHRVTVPGFSMLRTEVTAAQYLDCVEAGACTRPPAKASCTLDLPDRSEHPINCVDWGQAAAFCAWAGGRLPTEAEWEHAARAGRALTYPWGAELPSAGGRWRANYDCYDVEDGYDREIYGRDGFKETAPVCSFAGDTGAAELCDLGGNVWEWVQDWFGPYDDAPSRAPTGPAQGAERVMRGGSWGTPARNLRTSGRFWKPPTYRAGDVGMRCVR